MVRSEAKPFVFLAGNLKTDIQSKNIQGFLLTNASILSIPFSASQDAGVWLVYTGLPDGETGKSVRSQFRVSSLDEDTRQELCVIPPQWNGGCLDGNFRAASLRRHPGSDSTPAECHPLTAHNLDPKVARTSQSEGDPGHCNKVFWLCPLPFLDL